jgi:hypothetical protein
LAAHKQINKNKFKINDHFINQYTVHSLKKSGQLYFDETEGTGDAKDPNKDAPYSSLVFSIPIILNFRIM